MFCHDITNYNFLYLDKYILPYGSQFTCSTVSLISLVGTGVPCTRVLRVLCVSVSVPIVSKTNSIHCERHDGKVEEENEKPKIEKKIYKFVYRRPKYVALCISLTTAAGGNPVILSRTVFLQMMSRERKWKKIKKERNRVLDLFKLEI